MSKNLFESIDNLDRLTNTINEDSYEESVDKIDNLLSMCYEEYKNSDSYKPEKEELEEYMDLTDEEYEAAVNKLGELNNLPRYEGLLELSSNTTLHNLGDKLSERFGDLSDEDSELAMEIYNNHLATALDSFKEATGIECYTEGRMGKHICVEDTYAAASRYEELKQVQKEMEDHLIDEVVEELANEIGTNESQDLNERDDEIDQDAQTELWELVDDHNYGYAMVDAVCKKYNISRELADRAINNYIEFKKEREDELNESGSIADEYDFPEDIENIETDIEGRVERFDNGKYFARDVEEIIDTVLRLNHYEDDEKLKKYFMSKYYNMNEDFTAVEPTNPEEIQGVEESKDLKEQILADGTESELNTLIEDIKELQNTIKHTIEDSIISLNARISKINEDNGLRIDEIDTDNIYSNLSGVISDIEYEIKDSNWSKEDAENASEDE